MPVPYTRRNQIRLWTLYSALKEVHDRRVETQALLFHMVRLVKPEQAAFKLMLRCENNICSVGMVFLIAHIITRSFVLIICK